MKARILFVFLLLGTVVALRADTKPFSAPPARHAKTYPAHESHDDEKVSIAIDPFDTPDKAEIFRINYQEIGFLPVRLIISNDGDKPLMLSNLRIEYITAKRDKIEPATLDSIYRRFVQAKRNLHVPLRDKELMPVADELDQAMFTGHPVDSHSIRSGFLFFDIRGIDPPEAGAHVYITGLKVEGKELFYFDIPLEKYLGYQPGK